MKQFCIFLFAACFACSNAASLLRGNSDSPACTNDADTSIWSSKGKANFNTDMTTCGKKCLGGSSCVQGCIKSAEGYSDACSACFGALGGCTAKNCMAQCIGGQTPACVTCTQTHCVDPFVSCSGIPKSDITPTPAPVGDVVNCDASAMITLHEGSRKCAYTDTTGHKTVGVGFNLDAVSASTFESILPGVDYNSVYSGATCLTSGQISTLLHYSMKGAIAESRRVVSNYDSMCCNVQNVVTDMTFNLGSLSSFNTLVKYFEAEDWSDASADMKGTLWCKQVGLRCTEDAAQVAKGCGGPVPSPTPGPAPGPTPSGGCKACVSGGGGSGCLSKCAICGSTCTNCIKGGGGKACAERCCALTVE